MSNRPVGTRQARDLLRVAFGPSVVALVIIAAVVLLGFAFARNSLRRRERMNARGEVLA